MQIRAIAPRADGGGSRSVDSGRYLSLEQARDNRAHCAMLGKTNLHKYIKMLLVFKFLRTGPPLLLMKFWNFLTLAIAFPKGYFNTYQILQLVYDDDVIRERGRKQGSYANRKKH